MSVLTEKMLSALDYEAEDLSRKINFERLHSSLSKYNLLQIKKTPDHAPQFYPLLVNADIRNMLIGKKIYIPLMWRSTLSEEFNGFDEKWLSEKLICLPISSDYSQKDMDYLIETVIASIT
jgi:dTDP-4-amino-4,6-dideoxygalactose transaminase